MDDLKQQLDVLRLQTPRMFIPLVAEDQPDVASLCTGKEFARGTEGTPEKQQFAADGGVIVQRSVAMHVQAYKYNDRERFRGVLVADRNYGKHDVHCSPSILLSGDMHTTPEDILNTKGMEIVDRFIEKDVRLLGIGLSVRKDIRYLFEIYSIGFVDTFGPSTHYNFKSQGMRMISPKKIYAEDSAEDPIHTNQMEMGVLTAINEIFNERKTFRVNADS